MTQLVVVNKTFMNLINRLLDTLMILSPTRYVPLPPKILSNFSYVSVYEFCFGLIFPIHCCECGAHERAVPTCSSLSSFLWHHYPPKQQRESSRGSTTTVVVAATPKFSPFGCCFRATAALSLSFSFLQLEAEAAISWVITNSI